MSIYRKFLKETAGRHVVFAFGRFQPPTIGHGLLIKKVKDLAQQHRADHIVYASKTNDKKQNPLHPDTKVEYLGKMFPNTNFKAADKEVPTFLQAAAHLNKHYKHLTMVAGSDRVDEYKALLHKYNGNLFHFDSINVVSAGQRDPDSDSEAGMSGTKMRNAAKERDFESFRKGIPHTVSDDEAHHLMTHIRKGLGLTEAQLRELYLSNQIFKLNDKVTDGEQIYEILSRGTNYLLLVNESGNMSRKWLYDVYPILEDDTNQIPNKNGDPATDTSMPAKPDKDNDSVLEQEIKFKGYKTKNFHLSDDAFKAFRETIKDFGDHKPVDVLKALKATDIYLGLNEYHNESNVKGKVPNKKLLAKWNDNHELARKILMNIGEFPRHQEYWTMHENDLADYDKNFNYADSWEDWADSYQLNGKLLESDMIIAKKVARTLGRFDTYKYKTPSAIIKSAIKNTTIAPEESRYKKAINMIKSMSVKPNVNENINFYLPDEKDAHIIFQHDNDIHKVETASLANKIETVRKNHHTSRMGYSLGSNSEIHRRQKIKHRLGEDMDYDQDDSGNNQSNNLALDNLTDEQLDNIINSLSFDELLSGYDDDELAIADQDTGDIVDDNLNEELIVINEMLSRAERLKARIRFAMTKSKRERRLMIALKRKSTTKVINRRARKLAVSTLEELIAKRPLAQLSIPEKERVERLIQTKKALLTRMALKLIPKIKAVEQKRLSHPMITQ